MPALIFAAIRGDFSDNCLTALSTKDCGTVVLTFRNKQWSIVVHEAIDCVIQGDYLLSRYYMRITNPNQYAIVVRFDYAARTGCAEHCLLRVSHTQLLDAGQSVALADAVRCITVRKPWCVP